MGRRITREEVMEGIWDAYKGMVENERRKDGSTVGFPDMETVFKHIEEHGLPPKIADAAAGSLKIED